jgi:hypothetical protein
MDEADRNYLRRLIDNLKTARGAYPDLYGRMVIMDHSETIKESTRKRLQFFAVPRPKDFYDAEGPWWYFFYSTKKLDRARKWLSLQPDPSEERLEAMRDEMQACREMTDAWLRFQGEAEQGGNFLMQKKLGWLGTGSHELAFKTPLFHRWCVSIMEWATGLPEDAAEHISKHVARDMVGKEYTIGNYWDKSLAYAEWLLVAPGKPPNHAIPSNIAGRRKPKAPRSQNVKDIIRLASEGLDNDAITSRLPRVGADQVRQVRCDYAEQIQQAAKPKKTAGVRNR